MSQPNKATCSEEMNGATRYFSGTELVSGGEVMRNEKFAITFPGVQGKRSDSFSKHVGRNKAGELRPVTRIIFFKKNPSLHKCDGRCLNATGRTCECSCGGKNHGAGNSFSCAEVAA